MAEIPEKRNICLCSDCEGKINTSRFREMFSHFGYAVTTGTGWFYGWMPCHGCGTTEPGHRWGHGLQPISEEKQKLLKQAPLCEFTEYDKQLTYAAHIDLSAKDERTKA